MGKSNYELRDLRREKGLNHIAIIRIEQLYPFPDDEMFAAIESYENLKSVVWCQEEPRNQGAWYNSQHRLRRVVDRLNKKLSLRFAGRKSSASPAAGYMALHLREQAALLAKALAIPAE